MPRNWVANVLLICLPCYYRQHGCFPHHHGCPLASVGEFRPYTFTRHAVGLVCVLLAYLSVTITGQMAHMRQHVDAPLRIGSAPVYRCHQDCFPVMTICCKTAPGTHMFGCGGLCMGSCAPTAHDCMMNCPRDVCWLGSSRVSGALMPPTTL